MILDVFFNQLFDACHVANLENQTTTGGRVPERKGRKGLFVFRWFDVQTQLQTHTADVLRIKDRNFPDDNLLLVNERSEQVFRRGEWVFSGRV